MGRRIAGCLVAGAVAAGFTILSCGSSDDNGAADGADASDAGGDSTKSDGASSSDAKVDACGPAVCALSPGACGTVTDACGNKIACGLCQYGGEVAVSGFPSNNFPVALALGPAFDVAYPGGLAVRASAGSWTANGGPGASGTYLVDLAVATDGTVWIAFLDTSFQLKVAHGMPNVDAGAYTVETVTTRPAYAAAIAIGSDGVPVVAYAGYDSTVTMGAASIWRRSSGGSWTETPVATGSSGTPFQSIALAMHGTEENVLFLDPAASGTLSYGHADGASTFTVEPVATGVGTVRFDEMDIDVDPSGGPHVVYGNSYAEKSGGTWTKEVVAPPNFFVGLDTAEPVHVAVSPSGTVAYGALQGDVLWIAMRSGGAWSSQAVVRRCDFTQSFDMAYDTTSALAISHTCGPDRIDFMLQQGTYPADYATTCASVGAAACNEANLCTLNPQGKPCVNSSSNSTCIDFGYCPDYIALGLCADATQDASVMTACLAALPDAGCEPADAGDPGLILPSVCPPAF